MCPSGLNLGGYKMFLSSRKYFLEFCGGSPNWKGKTTPRSGAQLLDIYQSKTLAIQFTKLVQMKKPSQLSYKLPTKTRNLIMFSPFWVPRKIWQETPLTLCMQIKIRCWKLNGLLSSLPPSHKSHARHPPTMIIFK